MVKRRRTFQRTSGWTRHSRYVGLTLDVMVRLLVTAASLQLACSHKDDPGPPDLMETVPAFVYERPCSEVGRVLGEKVLADSGKKVDCQGSCVSEWQREGPAGRRVRWTATLTELDWSRCRVRVGQDVDWNNQTVSLQHHLGKELELIAAFDPKQADRIRRDARRTRRGSRGWGCTRSVE